MSPAGACQHPVRTTQASSRLFQAVLLLVPLAFRCGGHPSRTWSRVEARTTPCRSRSSKSGRGRVRAYSTSSGCTNVLGLASKKHDHLRSGPRNHAWLHGCTRRCAHDGSLSGGSSGTVPLHANHGTSQIPKHNPQLAHTWKYIADGEDEAPEYYQLSSHETEQVPQVDYYSLLNRFDALYAPHTPTLRWTSTPRVQLKVAGSTPRTVCLQPDAAYPVITKTPPTSPRVCEATDQGTHVHTGTDPLHDSAFRNHDTFIIASARRWRDDVI